VFGNAVFASNRPISVVGKGAASTQNVVDIQTNAAKYLNNPLLAAGTLDMYPKLGSALRQEAVDLTGVEDCPNWDKDFNGDPRDPAYRGAYSGQGTNLGWALALDFKP
jgi:hypothetical protein